MCEFCDREPEQPSKIEKVSMTSSLGDYSPKHEYSINKLSYSLSSSYNSSGGIAYNA